MTLLRVSRLLVCTWVCLATLIAATEPARVHEARQGPVSTPTSASGGPGPASQRTTSSAPTATMSPTPSASSSSNASSAAPQPSSSPGSLSFTIRNMTTCTSGLISWTYSGRAADLFLSVTNIGVDQYYALPRVRARQDTINTTVQQQLVDTNTSVQSWTWPSVNVTQGWYQIQGLVLATPTVRNNSASFFVSNGTDVACLTTSPHTSSTTTPSSVSPVSGVSKSNVASIAGGVVGAVAGVALAVFAGVWLWSRRRRRWPVGIVGRRGRKWDSLKSTSSSIHPGGGGVQLANNHFHAHSESTGAIIQAVAGGKASGTSTPGGSDEDVTTMGEEKLVSPASPSGMSPIDVLSTPIRYDRRTSTQSVQTPTAVVNDASRSRTASLHIANQSLEQQAHRIRSSMETSRRRSERLSMPTLPSPGLARFSHSQTKEEYPLSPVTPTLVNRSVSAGAVSTTTPARRASRKPVPHYDSSALLEDTKNTDSVSTFTAGAESSQSHGTGMGTGVYGTPPDLVHKASFGDGRPMHYLIPDMPPLQQD